MFNEELSQNNETTAKVSAGILAVFGLYYSTVFLMSFAPEYFLLYVQLSKGTLLKILSPLQK